ncbi:Uncharacterized protein Adt_40798 [Abeliophyllum distichum]|uniref:Uncharacterized protein n=1 Tax=Abeliophyllum distichum TaxID=126358 RepID=A0ABD1PMR5_9LAMI
MSSVITALLSGLRNHGFRASLSKKPVKSMTELLQRDEEYIDQEEVLKTARCDREVYDGGNKKTRCEEPSTHKHNTRSMTKYRYRPRPDLVNAISQIQLNAPLSVILQEISTLKELQWPERLRFDPSIRDHSHRCEFHKDHGHTTDQFRTLRSEVERLVSKGLLKNFVKKNDDRHEQMVEGGGKKRRAGVINVIVGGSTGGGDSKNSRKGYARSLYVNSIGVSIRFGQSVTFNDDDLEGVSLPHDDVLVITDDIADFDVRRVFVDTGSAANVMSWEAFKGLKIPTDRLKSINTSLQGFGRRTFRTLRSDVERLVSKGLLKNFVKKNDDRHEQMVEGGGKKTRAGVINVIVGGSTGGGDSKNSRKGYARSLYVNLIGVSSRFGQSVTFNDDDLEGVSLPQDECALNVYPVS